MLPRANRGSAAACARRNDRVANIALRFPFGFFSALRFCRFSL
jgi:hypothetical protein